MSKDPVHLSDATAREMETQRRQSVTTANPAPAQKPEGDKAPLELDDKHVAGTTLGNYVFDKSLGKGTFGKVKLAVHSKTGEKVTRIAINQTRRERAYIYV